MATIRLVLIVALAAALSGCETAPVKEIRSLFTGGAGAQSLASGIRHYEEGRYGESARLLQSSLDEGLSRSDQVRAYKYLAFIHCISGREAQCRNEFRAALRVDPDFELAATEAGHPTWGPVFRSVKARR